jgi:uncharacterized protein YqeY
LALADDAFTHSIIHSFKIKEMSLVETINQDIKKAMLAKEADKLRGLRAVKAALLLASTEKGAAEEITGETEIKVLQKLVKQRKESADIYKAQNRDDLYQIEVEEQTVIEAYLPKQMSKEEVEVYLKDLIGRVGATSVKDMGKVMGAANKELAGKADGKTISEVVKQLLA